MEWVTRQACFFVFVLLCGWLLSAEGNGAAPWRGMLSPLDESSFEQSKRFSVPLLLYAAAELCCYGRGASVLLPIRMLSLAYGAALYMGLYAASRLLSNHRARKIAGMLVFPLTAWEASLLGYVLLRDGHCRSAAAAAGGAAGLAAAVLMLTLSAGRRAKLLHRVRFVR